MSRLTQPAWKHILYNAGKRGQHWSLLAWRGCLEEMGCGLVLERQQGIVKKKQASWLVARLKQRRVAWVLIVLAGMVLAIISLIPLHLLAPVRLFVNAAPPVIPALREWHGGSSTFDVTPASRIAIDSAFNTQLRTTAQTFQSDLQNEVGLHLPIVTTSSPGAGNFFLTLQTHDSKIGDEGYLLDVANSVTINARTSNGVFYGTRTVLQILREASDHASIPIGSARDYPMYKERGLMLDVGRKFVPLSLLESYVRMMAWYKFNDFQLHFNDNAPDGGNKADWQHEYAAFRLNSPAFPGLAAKDGSYTEQQIRQLEAVASAYAVTITPEIDTPAHSLALTQYRPDLASPTYSKEFLNLSDPDTYTFVDSLWKTFLPWFTAPQVNMGMDEYATQDADRYREYINHIDMLLRSLGKTTRMWGSLSKMQSSIPVNPQIVIEDWDNTWANPIAMMQQGFKIINANDLELYIVPHTSYFHDFLDTQMLYNSWDPSIFSLQDPSLNLRPGDPHLLGATFAVWNDKMGTIVSDADITSRIEPALPVLGEKMWNGSGQAFNYDQFEEITRRVGFTPATVQLSN